MCNIIWCKSVLFNTTKQLIHFLQVKYNDQVCEIKECYMIYFKQWRNIIQVQKYNMLVHVMKYFINKVKYNDINVKYFTHITKI